MKASIAAEDLRMSIELSKKAHACNCPSSDSQTCTVDNMTRQFFVKHCVESVDSGDDRTQTLKIMNKKILCKSQTSGMTKQFKKTGALPASQKLKGGQQRIVNFNGAEIKKPSLVSGLTTDRVFLADERNVNRTFTKSSLQSVRNDVPAIFAAIILSINFASKIKVVFAWFTI